MGDSCNKTNLVDKFTISQLSVILANPPSVPSLRFAVQLAQNSTLNPLRKFIFQNILTTFLLHPYLGQEEEYEFLIYYLKHEEFISKTCLAKHQSIMEEINKEIPDTELNSDRYLDILRYTTSIFLC